MGIREKLETGPNNGYEHLNWLTTLPTGTIATVRSIIKRKPRKQRKSVRWKNAENVGKCIKQSRWISQNGTNCWII